jgi:oligopeptide transport system substrate-binding protein
MGEYWHSAAILALGLGILSAPGMLPAHALRVNVEADPATMDSIANSDKVANVILKNVYEGFTEERGDGTIVPALATSWDVLSQGRAIRFHLRTGVLFHSGRAFTAKDVKYTFETLLAPESRSGVTAEYLDDVVGAADVRSGKTKELEGVRIIDDHTVEIRFTKPDVLFPIYPIQFMDSGIVAELGPDWMSKASAGTGAFKFKRWRRGEEVDLEANQSYWGGAPKIDGVRFLIVPNLDTALSQYDAGELDVLDVQEAIFRRVLRDASYADQIQKTPRAQSRYLGMNQNLYAPFKDIRVRQAISLSIDRDALIRGLYDGAAYPLNGVITPGIEGFNPDLPALKYDPEKARKLLAQAGYPGGKGMPPIDISCTPPYKDEITYYASQFHRVLGMQVTVNVVERTTFIREMNIGKVAFFPWGWTAGYPDALSYLLEMWYGRSPYNRSQWRNARYDAVIDEAQATVDSRQRFALYHTAEKILMDDWVTAPLPMTAIIGLRKPNVKNVRLTPFGFEPFKDVEIH